MFARWIALALLLPSLALAEKKVAVMPLKGGLGVEPQLAELVTDALVAAIQTRSGLQVVTWKDVENALQLEKKKAELSVEVARRTGEEVCTENSCLTEIAGALGASLSVSGTVSKLGSSYVLAAQLYDQRKALVTARFHKTASAENAEAVLGLAGEAAEALFAARRPPGEDRGDPRGAAWKPASDASREPEPAGWTTPARPRGSPPPSTFVGLEQKFSQFRAWSPRSPEELSRQLQRHTVIARDLETGYRNVMRTATPEWAVSCEVRIGQVYEHLARTVSETPLPLGLPADSRAYLQGQADAQARPLWERARQLLQTALDDAERHGVNNREVEEAREALRR
ncbi:MAG: hypothetical protein ACK4N5_26680, partial [Myxococcales bacterium]